MVQGDILPQLVFSLNEQNVGNCHYLVNHRCSHVLSHTINVQRFYKKSAAFVLRSIAKHSPQLAQSVVDSGALRALVQCLEEFDPGVKEATAWALGYIARHSSGMAGCYQCTLSHYHVCSTRPL